MTSFRGQASSAKMTSLGGGGSKLKALACHPTKRVNIAEEVTYLSTNIGQGYHNMPRSYRLLTMLDTHWHEFTSVKSFTAKSCWQVRPE
jgi:hypothetical protein